MADACVSSLSKLIAVLNSYSGRDKAMRSLYFALVLATTRLSHRRAEIADHLLALSRQLSCARFVARQLNMPQLLQLTWRVPGQLRLAYLRAGTELRRNSIIQQENSHRSITSSKSDDNEPSTGVAAAAAAVLPIVHDSKEESTNYRKLSSFACIGFIDALWRVFFTRRGGVAATRLVDEVLAASVTLLYTLNAGTEFVAWVAEVRIVSADTSRWFRYSLYCWVSALSAGVLRQTLRVQRLGWTTAAGAGDLLTLAGIAADLVAALNMLPSVGLRPGGRKLSAAQSAGFSLIASLIGLYKAF